MGFEIQYSYHEKVEEGYNKDETKTKKKKVGDPFEDVPLERLASEIIKLMARRDVFVVGVQIFELAKKEISFRETKGGIVLKNRKFMFDDDANPVTFQVQDEMPSTIAIQSPATHMTVIGAYGPMEVPMSDVPVHMQPASTAGMQPHNRGQLRAVKYMTFAPELQMMPEVKSKGLRFTPDKKYPVFQIQPHPSGIGEVYKMVDDSGREQLVSDKYFVPGDQILLADRELGFSESPSQRDGGKLYWGGANQENNMPDIRGRR